MDASVTETQKIIAQYQTTLDTSAFWQKCKKVHTVLLIISSVIIMVSIAVAAGMRYFFEMDFFGLDEFVLIAACLVYFVGAAQGSFERSHIAADFIESLIAKKGFLGGFLCIQRTIEVLMSYVFVYWSFLMLEWCIKAWPVSPVWRIPFLVPEAIMLLSFIMIAVYTTAHYVLLLRIIIKNKK